ncbi:ATP-binding protein [Paenibacillus sp. FSL L8-0470]|uniref:ATP-binding protein n=1 Tax=unclassified Paenibacillus TaxID=185978 RepID=UPI0030F6724D
MFSFLQRPRVSRRIIYIFMGLVVLATTYIQIQLFTNPYSGISVEPDSSGGWIISRIDRDSPGSRTNLKPGDRILAFDGEPEPEVFIVDRRRLLTGTHSLKVESKEGQPYTLQLKAGSKDKLENGFAFVMEIFLVGVGTYALCRNPESLLIRRFLLMNLLFAFVIVALFSDELMLSGYLFTFCAIWMPYAIISFYLLFAFRPIYSKFRALLRGYQVYSLMFSVFAVGFMLQRHVYDWVTNVLNVALLATLLLMAAITVWHWSKFDRIEKNQLYILFTGITVSLLPYVWLYALPYLLWDRYWITAEYALVGLVPISATFTYLLVQRQVLDMRFYIPRLAAHSLYFSLTLVLFLLTTVWGSIGYAVLLFILLALLTGGYRLLLRRLRHGEKRKKDWLEQQKLLLSLQLAGNKNIRDILKLFAELLQDMIEVEGLTLVYFDDSSLPLVHNTGIYEEKGTKGPAPLRDTPDLEWSAGGEYAAVFELVHELEEQRLGYLCLGPKRNQTLFSAEEQRIIQKFRSEAVQMLMNARHLLRLRREYEDNQKQIDHYERQVHDFRSYSQSLLEAREAEKVRISYFLHDDLLQNLIFLSRDLEELHDTGRYQQERNAKWLKCLADSQRSIRALSDHLYPHILDKGDLQEALHWLLQDMNRLEELNVTLQFEAPLPDAFPVFIKASLFRAARELVVNVFKHAMASELKVRVWIDGDSIYCSVSDNGVGFNRNIAVTAPPDGRPRFGLLSIREQMEHLGGTALIDSVPEQGTSVTLKIPLYKEQSSHE